MEGKYATKRPISATVTANSSSRTPFTRSAPQVPVTKSGPGLSPPPTGTAVEPQAVPRPVAVAPPRAPRSIAQLKSLSQQEMDVLIQGKTCSRKPPLQRALSHPGQTAGGAGGDEESAQMKELMRELRRCRYLRTSQEEENEVVEN